MTTLINGHRVLVPSARRFKDIFDEFMPFALKTEPGSWARRITKEDWIGAIGTHVPCGKPPLGTMRVGPFCALRMREWTGALWVRPTADVGALLEEVVLLVTDDVLSFDVIEWEPAAALVVAAALGGEPGERGALVTVSHSRIIGSHWLAFIDASTVPPEGVRNRREEVTS